MRVFVTGASGFVGSAIVKDLLAHGHKVLGLVRNADAAKKLEDLGAEPRLGDITNLAGLEQAAAECDAIIHTAFNHDFSRYKESCEDDRRIITAMGEAIKRTGKPLVVTSGIGLLRYDRVVTEDGSLGSSAELPRAASEEAANDAASNGAKTYIVRLPPTTHGAGDHGFVPMIADMAKQNGKSAYIGDGNNLWPAAHRHDAAQLYRLIIEQQPEQRVFHAVAEQGIPFKEIAKAISDGLNLPLESLTAEDAEKHFTWFTHFAMMDCEASAEKTKATLGWQPTHIDLIQDLKANYF